MKKLIIILIFSAILFANCKKNKTPANCPNKDEVCDNALLYVGNKTQDTLFFSFGSVPYNGHYPNKIPPGQVMTFKESGVEIVYDKSNCQLEKHGSSTGTIYSNFGAWGYSIDHCLKVSNFRYEDTIKKLHVKLYDDTPN